MFAHWCATLASSLYRQFFAPAPPTMSDHTYSSVPNKRFVLICAFVTMFVSVLVLIGWAFDVKLLKSVIAGHPEMKPVTAIAFILIGGALFLSALAPQRRMLRLAVAAIGGIVFAAAIVTLSAYVLATPTFADWFLVPDLNRADDSVGNRMSPHSALNFFLVGVSLALLNARRRLAQVSAFTAIVSVVATYAAVLGHLYLADSLYSLNQMHGMAIHTAFVFLIVSVSLVAANSECRLVSLFLSDSLGGQAARRLLPVVILVPTFVGWLRVMGQDAGLYDTGFGTAMSTFILALMMFAMIFYYSSTVHTADKKRQLVEADLAEKENRYRELFDYSQGLICIHDLEGALTTVNRAALQMLGYAEHEMLGRNLRDFMPDKRRPSFDAYLREVTHEGLAHGFLELTAKCGKTITLRFHNVLATEEGKEPYVLGHAQDVSELFAAQEQLRNLSLTDELTGLYNRRGFLNLADQQLRLERHKSTARGLTLMFADMDGLKTINDVFGHEDGSEAIRVLATTLKTIVRSADLVARWGGDEFVLLTIGSDNENAAMLAERLKERLDEYNETSGKPYKVACSIGIAPVVLDGRRTFEDIIAEADVAMYADKKKRKAARTGQQTPAPPQDLNPMHDSLGWY